MGIIGRVCRFSFGSTVSVSSLSRFLFEAPHIRLVTLLGARTECLKNPTPRILPIAVGR